MKSSPEIFTGFASPKIGQKMTTNNDYQCLSSNRAPLTAAINIANLTAALQELAHPEMAVLDVKDMFFTILLQDKDKKKFALPYEGMQYTITRLPKGYKPVTAHAVLAEFLQTVSLLKL